MFVIVTMNLCDLCKRTFANKHSLRTHRYQFHRGTDSNKMYDEANYQNSSQCGQDCQEENQYSGKLKKQKYNEYRHLNSDEKQDDMESDESCLSQSSQSDAENNSSQESSNEISSKISRKRKRSPSTQYRTKRAHVQLESKSNFNQQVIERLFAIEDQLISIKEDSEHNTVNMNSAVAHAKLIKMLCKAVLNGTIPPHCTHPLKPHATIIRKIAHGSIKDAEKTIRNEASKTYQKGGSILKTVLETILPIIPSLLL